MSDQQGPSAPCCRHRHPAIPAVPAPVGSCFRLRVPLPPRQRCPQTGFLQGWSELYPPPGISPAALPEMPPRHPRFPSRLFAPSGERRAVCRLLLVSLDLSCVCSHSCHEPGRQALAKVATRTGVQMVGRQPGGLLPYPPPCNTFGCRDDRRESILVSWMGFCLRWTLSSPHGLQMASVPAGREEGRGECHLPAFFLRAALTPTAHSC